MQIIYLNGPSSVGKTTLAKALQNAFDEPFLHISFDKVIGWMPQKMNDWTGGHASAGFSWKALQDESGALMYDLQMGPFASKMQHAFRDVALTLAKAGHHLIIDDFSFGIENISTWRELLQNFPVLWVGLSAPLDELEKRERERGSRILGSARAQHLQFNQKIGYDIELDTHAESINTMIQKIQERLCSPIRSEIQRIVHAIRPFDNQEAEHLSFVHKWIESGAEIFRTAKPATPDTHLVSYFVLVDQAQNKVLLTDHKKSGLWLPAGGHVELNEHPKETVKREILEELGIQADFLSHDPLFLTVTKTVGETAGHTDISLWYVLRGNASDTLNYDNQEFHQIRWFLPTEIPYPRTDPHMDRLMQKLSSLKILN